MNQILKTIPLRTLESFNAEAEKETRAILEILAKQDFPAATKYMRAVLGSVYMDGRLDEVKQWLPEH